MEVESGTMGRLPYAAAGTGRPLVYLNGLVPGTGVESDRWVRLDGTFFAPFVSRRRVYFFNRRPGLPRGMTMAEIAAEHAEALRAGFGGDPVDVMGLSLGGAIAQQLAADHHDVVRRLVLVSTACRVGAEGRELERRVAARIRKGAYRQGLAVMVAGLVPRWRGRLAAGTVAWLAAPWILPGDDDLADMATTMEAEEAFDLATCRSPIAAPTLIVVGGKDVWYDRELFDETARLIPNSRLIVHERRGHDSVTRRPGFASEILEFLEAG